MNEGVRCDVSAMEFWTRGQRAFFDTYSMPMLSGTQI